MVSVHGTRSVDPQELLLDGSRKTSLWPSTGRPGSEYFDFLQALGDCPIHISLVEELLERIFGSNNMGGSAAAQGGVMIHEERAHLKAKWPSFGTQYIIAWIK